MRLIHINLVIALLLSLLVTPLALAAQTAIEQSVVDADKASQDARDNGYISDNTAYAGPINNTKFESNQTGNNSQCRREPEIDEWVDRLRASTHSRLCYGVSWVDGLFGDDFRFQGENLSGKVSLGFKHDEVEGIDPRLRVRIRAKLPNVSKRIDAFIGRVDEDSFISNTENKQDIFNNVGLRNAEDRDNEWLVGLGYRRPRSDSNGFDFSTDLRRDYRV